MNTTLFFWRQRPETGLLPADIAAELRAGNDVEGLIDLPVQEIIASLKESFPQAVERAGELSLCSGDEWAEATWSWQYVRCDCRDVTDETRERLIAVLERFDCPAYDVQLGIRLAD